MTDTESNAAPMRLRSEPPRVTRLSRKMLASVAAVAQPVSATTGGSSS